MQTDSFYSIIARFRARRGVHARIEVVRAEGEREETLALIREGRIAQRRPHAVSGACISAYAIDDCVADSLLDRVETAIARLVKPAHAASGIHRRAPVRRTSALQLLRRFSRGRYLGVTPKSFLPNSANTTKPLVCRGHRPRRTRRVAGGTDGAFRDRSPVRRE